MQGIVDGRKPRFGIVYLQDVDLEAFRELRATARCVYYALLPYAGQQETGETACWPKVKRLMALTGFGERTVRRAVADLERAGFLAIGKKETPRGKINLYILRSPGDDSND
tara:strand:+ start:1077 stop:1409 length:333 start_codon:yes stop_codon:yes gene_type:complete